MSYQIAYNPNLDNAIVGISENFPIAPEGMIILNMAGEIPDLSKMQWNPVSLHFEQKHTLPITKLAFLRRFSAVERVAIRNLAKTDVWVDDFMRLLDICEEIHVWDGDTVSAINYMVYKEVILPERISEILA